jgi:hypothetical protein
MNDIDRHKSLRARGHTALVFGALGITLSGLFLLYCFAFANIVRPDIQGIERIKLVAYRMFELPGPGIGTIPAAIVFVCSIIAFARGAYFSMHALTSGTVSQSPKAD